MAQQITQLGEAMRNPSVVSDRWTLLAEIQRFRSAFREQISNLVYSSISAFADVSRKEVVPGYEAEVKASMTVRAIVADLGRILSARLAKVRDAAPGDIQTNAQQLQNELDAFGRTAAYRGAARAGQAAHHRAPREGGAPGFLCPTRRRTSCSPCWRSWMAWCARCPR